MCKDDLCVFLSLSVFCFLFVSKAACSRDFRVQIRLVCSSDLALPAAARRDRVELMPSMASRYSQRPSGPDDDKRRSFKDGWGQAPGGGGASSSAPPILEKRKREQPQDDSASKKLAPIFPPYLVFYYFIFPHCSLFLLGSLLTAMWNPFRFFCFLVGAVLLSWFVYPIYNVSQKFGRRRALLEQRRSLPIASGTKELFSLFDALLVFQMIATNFHFLEAP